MTNQIDYAKDISDFLNIDINWLIPKHIDPRFPQYLVPIERNKYLFKGFCKIDYSSNPTCLQEVPLRSDICNGCGVYQTRTYGDE